MPEAPSITSLEQLGTESFVVNWVAPTSINIEKYNIKLRKDGNDVAESVAELETSMTTHTFDELSAGTAYTVIQQSNNLGMSSTEDPYYVTTCKYKVTLNIAISEFPPDR